MFLSNPAIYNLLDALGYFFYNSVLFRKFFVILFTMLFIRTIANFVYKYTIGAVSRMSIFQILFLTFIGFVAIIFGFQLLLMLEFGFILFSIALDLVYSYYEVQRFHKRINKGTSAKNTSNKAVSAKTSKSEKKSMNKTMNKALKKYQKTQVFQEAIRIAQKDGYTCFELFTNGIRFYRFIPDASFCRNWLNCEKTYTNPNAFLADECTVFNTSFMPPADTVKGLEFVDLPFHKYGMYSLDLEELQYFSFALQKKLTKHWMQFCHATEVRLNANGQTSSKIIALTYLFITKEALKYVS